MLVLSRKIGQSLLLHVPAGPERDIVIRPVRLLPGSVRLGIEADDDVTVLRSELLGATAADAACDPATAALDLERH